MNLEEFKKNLIKDDLSIDDSYGRVFIFIDFSNVNNWFEEDNQDWDNKKIADNEKISIDVKKLKIFTDTFGDRVRIYYGGDPKNKKSIHFTYLLRQIFGNYDFITKDLQKIKHYFNVGEKRPEKYLAKDQDGRDYIELRKCNFDVEISVDAIKMIKHYDTFCIFSGDADFVYLNNFLKKKGKNIIVIKGGYITNQLRKSADLLVNAQNIKKYIARITKT